MIEPHLERLTRSEARLRFGNRVVSIYGEAHLPGEYSPGWVIYSTAEKWEDGSPVLEHERSSIVEALAKAFQHRGIKYTID